MLDGGSYTFDVGTDDVIGVECGAEVEILVSVLLDAWLFSGTLLAIALAAAEKCSAKQKEKCFLHLKMVF